MYIADMLGYRPMGQQAASVDLEFTLDPNAAEDEVAKKITLPALTRIYNETDNADNLVVFELNTPVTLDSTVVPQVMTATSTATEGVTVNSELLGISLGIPNSEFIIPKKGVIFNSATIRTEEGSQTLPWTFVSDISLARPTQAAFTTFLDDNDSTHVVFGDNAAGRIPPVNANIYITYRYGVGAEANEIAAELINSIAAASVDTTTAKALWAVTVRNADNPIGGTDPESVDAMRYSIPRAAVRIKSRAVTLNDYADLALQVPGVAKSVSYGTVYTAVHVRLAPQDGEATADYMAQLCETVEDYMKDKVIVGSTVYAEPEDVNELWLPVYIRILVHVVDGFNRSSVRRQVDSVVRQVLTFDAVDFGWRVAIGKVYRAALSVQGVEWVELLWLDADFPGLDIGKPTLAQDQDMAPITGNTPTEGTVMDIATPFDLIPRIDPVEVEENEINFDGLPEEELTHDGLWVWAVGGVPGS